ncbi:sigma-70 family RNA polymerase sigma factor [Nakamurella alba]|uniref:sigma-70 family RNA polymerase sigma factor n=1 Tax=Nakamurella alba TaxID=2665158 RepID=UPI0012B6E6B2|nr:sigma-70 family RNA polymerase sigma factor [Nakamurella alba]
MEAQHVRALFDSQWQRTVALAGQLRAADPEDVAAEAFARLYSKRGSVRTTDAAVGYLRTTVINLVRDRARRQQLDARERSRAAPPIAEVVDRDPAVIEAVGALPERQREAVVLRIWLDLSERDAAAAMGVSAGSVKTHLSRALAALRPVLEGDRHVR